MSQTRTRAKRGSPPALLTLVSVTQAVLVEEYRSFRRAADALGVRQSAVSQGVRALEEALGVALFERDRASVRTTNAGAAFLAPVREAISQIRTAAKTAAAAGEGRVGRVRIGIQSSVATGYLRELVELYRSQHPRVDLRFCDASASDHVAAVRRRQVDVAFCSTPGKITGLDVCPVWSERILVALPRSHALARRSDVNWTDLGDQRVIVRSLDGNPALCGEIRREIETGDQRPMIEKIDVERETLMQLVTMGFGIGLTSESAIATSFPNVVFRPIVGNPSTVQYNAVWLQENDNPALRRFLSLARKMAKDRMQPTLAQRARSSAGNTFSLGLAFCAALGRKLGLTT